MCCNLLCCGCVVIFCVVFCCIVLHCFVLYGVVLCCVVLCCVVLCVALWLCSVVCAEFQVLFFVISVVNQTMQTHDIIIVGGGLRYPYLALYCVVLGLGLGLG